MFEVSSRGIQSLLHKFEGTAIEPPAPPRRERVVSALDGPRAEVDGVAAVERERAQNRISVSVPQVQVPTFGPAARKIPSISVSDSDEVRTLKREILAKEAEIQAMAAKFLELSDRLDRVVNLFQAAQNETFVDVQDDVSKGHFSNDITFEPASPIFGADSSSVSNRNGAFSEDSSLKSIGAAGGRPPSASKTGGTLAEILAAARGSATSSGRATSEKPKYASLLRNLK